MALSITESKKTKKPLTTKQCLLIAVLSLIFGATIFTVAYIGMTQHIGLGTLNQPILSWMIDYRESYITSIATTVSMAAGPISSLLVISFVIFTWVLIKHEAWRPFLFAISMGFATLTSMAMKLAISNNRPQQINMIAPFETTYSFPSGHTIGIAVFLLVLGYLIYSRHFSIQRFVCWFFVTIIGIGIVATSRLYLGYHWLTDIVASLGLGLIILAIIILIDTIVTRNSRN
ncbi:MAG: phosphatase PAP2 family protein [Candidatus Saccharibacteria bacterium]